MTTYTFGMVSIGETWMQVLGLLDPAALLLGFVAVLTASSETYAILNAEHLHSKVVWDASN